MFVVYILTLQYKKYFKNTSLHKTSQKVIEKMNKTIQQFNKFKVSTK